MSLRDRRAARGLKSVSSRPAHTQPASARYFAFPEIAGQNAWLDLLRAAAVMLVLVRHGERAVVSDHAPAAPFSDPLHALFMNGWVGVDLFLVLSGYLIAKSLLRMSDRADALDVQSYFRARALRIVPAYFFVLLVIAAGLIPFYAVSGDDMARRVIYHMLFLQDYLPADINVVFWSLGVEEKFYLLAPVLVYALVAVRSAKAALAILLALFLLSPCIKLAQFLAATSAPDYDQFFASFRSPFHLSLEPLAAGVAVAWLQHRKMVSLSPTVAKRMLAVAGIALTAWLMSHEFLAEITLLDAALQPALIALLCGCMVLAATCLATAPTPGAEIWRPISRLSYALYLVHFPLIPLCMVSADALHAPFWLVYMAVIFPAAAWLHFAVEKPFLILKDRGAHKRSLTVNAEAP